MTQQHTQPAGIPFDKQDQLQQIQSGLMEGERVLAVYDAIGVGTGFIGLTDRRVIIQDKSFVGKKGGNYQHSLFQDYQRECREQQVLGRLVLF